MATNNAYGAYKRDTRYLVYWMINTCNGILRSLPCNEDADPSQVAVNFTGQTTVSGLVNMSQLIASNTKTIPSLIYRLLQSVIKARRATNALFEQMATNNPDPKLEKINATHKHFIEALQEAFRILRGEKWLLEKETSNEKIMEEANEALTNQFMALHMGEDDEDDEESLDGFEVQEPQVGRQQARVKKGKGKFKKGKPRRKGSTAWSDREQAQGDVPLEEYCIVEDEDGVSTEYLVALYGLFKELAQLRSNMQAAWHEVAYEGLNSAVAGAMSHTTFTMAKRLSSDIFLGFPGHDSYDTVMNTVTARDPDKIQGSFTVSLLKLSGDPNVPATMTETSLDVKEQFLIYAYNDMRDFILDFQKTHSGKPTKRMLSQIGKWDPYAKVIDMTDDERIQWRRAYTINWLYDLVNLFSAIVVQMNNTRGENHDLSKCDWSTTGVWDEYRRLYGLNEFAGFITTLAMQKNGTDFTNRIFPHHVLQLQCIVDAMMVSRGWLVDAVEGHVVEHPPRDFYPCRDVDYFLDRHSRMDGKGFTQGVDVIQHTLHREELLHGDASGRHGHLSDMLRIMQVDFRDWLGESKYKNGLETMPPSRFSHINTNGLWDYSPMLCATGLLECLELAYGTGMVTFDRIPEVVAVIHLHNMLVKKGYLETPVELFVSLSDLYQRQFYVKGEIPDKDFYGALFARLKETKIRAPHQQRQRDRRKKTAIDIHEMLTVKDNFVFNATPFTHQLRAANFDPERIPNSEIPVNSLVASTRLGRTKIITNPETGKRRMEETEIVRRARAEDITMEALVNLSVYWAGILDGVKQAQPEYMDQLGHTIEWENPNARTRATLKDMSCTEIVNLVRWDVFRDVCADGPVLSLNYIWVATRIMIIFMGIERKLAALRNRHYIQTYEKKTLFERSKRVGLTLLAMTDEDEECLKVMASEFEFSRTGFMSHMYWDEIEDATASMKAARDRPDDCPVM